MAGGFTMYKLIAAILFFFLSMDGHSVEFENEDGLSALKIPNVVTPSKILTPKTESPVGVTRIDADTIYYLGFTSYDDVMWLVPGMKQSYFSQNSPSMSYHSLNGPTTKRTELLADELKVNRPANSGTDWGRLPIRLYDLDAIEVARGSSSSIFGSNAFSAAVNLIRRNDSYVAPTQLRTRVGSADTRDIYFLTGWTGEVSKHQIRLSGYTNSGFDKTIEDEDFHDDMTSKHFYYRSDYELNPQQSFFTDFIYMKNNFSQSNVSAFNNSDIALSQAFSMTNLSKDQEETYFAMAFGFENSVIDEELVSKISVKGNVNHYEKLHEFGICAPAFAVDPDITALDASPNINLEFADIASVVLFKKLTLNKSIVHPLSAADQATLDRVNQRLSQLDVASVLSPLCGTTNHDAIDQFQYIEASWDLSDGDLHMFNEISFKHIKLNSEAYLNGTATDNTLFMANHAQYNLMERAILHLGISSELNQDVSSKPFLNPRVGIVYKPSYNSAVRTTYAKAHRTPSIRERDTEWSYELQLENGTTSLTGDPSPKLFRTASNEVVLDAEQLESTEIGFFHQLESLPISYDVKYFDEHLSNLISESAFWLDYSQTNNGESNITGYEMELKFNFQPVQSGIVYTDMDTKTNAPEEVAIDYDYFGSIYGIFETSDQAKLAIAFYLAKETLGYDYERYDITYSHNFTVRKQSDLQLQFNLRQHNGSPIRFIGDASPTDLALVHIEPRLRFFMTTIMNF